MLVGSFGKKLYALTNKPIIYMLLLGGAIFNVVTITTIYQLL
jgi:hypothetical protein